MLGSLEAVGSSWEKYHHGEEAGHCLGNSLQGRVFLSISMLCACSFGNQALAIPVPRQQPGAMGYSFSHPRGQVFSSHPVQITVFLPEAPVPREG